MWHRSGLIIAHWHGETKSRSMKSLLTAKKCAKYLPNTDRIALVWHDMKRYSAKRNETSYTHVEHKISFAKMWYIANIKHLKDYSVHPVNLTSSQSSVKYRMRVVVMFARRMSVSPSFRGHITTYNFLEILLITGPKREPPPLSLMVMPYSPGSLDAKVLLSGSDGGKVRAPTSCRYFSMPMRSPHTPWQDSFLRSSAVKSIFVDPTEQQQVTDFKVKSVVLFSTDCEIPIA